MKRNVTAKGGPLHGKTYTVPQNMTEFPSPPGVAKGSYRLTEKQAIWQPAKDQSKPEGSATDTASEQDN